MLQAIRYSKGKLALLDQRLLPHEFTYLDVPDPKTSWQHIKDMVVRGAPAIGVTGALTMAVDLVANKGEGAAFGDAGECLAYINSTLDYLVTSRPTAVNLADGAERLREAATAAAQVAGATPASVVAAVVEAAEAYFAEDVRANKAMGEYGADALVAAVEAAGRRRGAAPGAPLRVLTHCNTGSLATAGWGTALGIIRTLAARGQLEHAYCTETRPYNQGARLTAYELGHDGLPATLVADSATAALMAAGQVDAVVVGADRVVANGDTANKIGTYMLSLVAAAHGVPFFIAAPTTTLDPKLDTGDQIEIEQRPAEELTHYKGQRVVTDKVCVWNPSFDVAPGRLIAAIITERGVIPKQGDTHMVRPFLAALSAGTSAAPAPDASGSPAVVAAGTTTPFTAATVAAYVASHPDLHAHVGPPEEAREWKVREVGDGNINFVWIVEGPKGGVAVKQCLPYLRCVGESWPLTQDRLRIESSLLVEHGRHCPDHVPTVFRYDPDLAACAMYYIKPPAVILRRGLMAGRTYPHLAAHVARYMASTLHATSPLALTSAQHKRLVAQYSNPEMCALTEEVVFRDPYTDAPNNRHNTPYLDGDVEALRHDVEAKVAISLLGRKFMTHAEALLHADLHTGSIMVTDTETKVIDPEFGFMGPMAFDTGKILGELLLALFASHGQEACEAAGSRPAPEGPRAAQREWLAECVVETWRGFEAEFVSQWEDACAAGESGAGCPPLLLGPDAPQGLVGAGVLQAATMRQLWQDTVGFMGAAIIRRVVGISHVADLEEGVPDPEVRAACERRALRFGRSLLVSPDYFSSVEDLVSTAAAAAAPK